MAGELIDWIPSRLDVGWIAGWLDAAQLDGWSAGELVGWIAFWYDFETCPVTLSF